MDSMDHSKRNESQNQELRGEVLVVYLRRTPFFL